MNIYIIRHGKDDNNYRGGWGDLPLIEEGINQAKLLSEYLYKNRRKFNIKKII